MHRNPTDKAENIHLEKPFKIKYQINSFINKSIEKHREGFADNITLCLENSMESLKDIINILESFGDISGLRINAKKNTSYDLWSQQYKNKTRRKHTVI